MPNLQDKLPEPPFPSELNPLTNPVLERNLGRWAQVYFSTPPAKRATGREQTAGRNPTGNRCRAPRSTVRPYFARDEKFQNAVCSACQHQNPPGHKFCSRCGQLLDPRNRDLADNRGATEVGEAAPPRSENDVQWLRDRAFSGLDGSDGPQRRAWKYLLGAFVLVLAGFAYLQWAPRPRAGVASSTRCAAGECPGGFAPPEDSSPAESKLHAEAISPESKATRGSEHGEPPRRMIAPPCRREFRPASQKSPLLGARPSHPALAGEESGASDLRLAQRYLGGSMGVRDSSEAAKLLWKAVSKQNATAAVLLSDLYLRGDGVPRSCDQARLLLVAAAKRGAPQAAQQLRNLESQGCQ